ncbi:MAG: metallophosphoesterase [Bacilli bacterium]|nr:metallophosphoesterase [Bacilli bacterium]
MKTRQEKNKKIRQKITREDRNKKIKKIVKVVSIILIVVTSIITYGMFIGAKIININEYKITNNQIPNSFHGVKVVHISDLLFNSLSSKDLNSLEKKINKLEPDILIFTGDIKRHDYELSKEDLDLLNNFFKKLNSSIKKYAVFGDNDNETFKTIMENSNFEVLTNQVSLLYNKDTTPIQIIGFDTNNLNLELATNNNYYSICIMHNPDYIDNILEKVNCNLALAGDNLGGEIKIPFSKGILNHNKYMMDYYKINNTEFYISNGLGNNYNIRLFNHPSINLYRLTKY